MSERQGVPPSDADEAETRVKEGPSDLAPAGQAPIGLAGGTMVDHFELVRPLGRGATGAVYLARDTQLGRKVAIKMVLPKLLGSERDLQRFVREARTTARFSHPHIVAVYAVGEHAGAPYVALEYLEGEDLRQRLLARRLGRQEALRVAHAVADAMAEAHRHGVLHRDLKPGNVVLPTDGRVRVVDFGLARIEQDAMVASSRFDRPPTIDGEQTDGVQGTPAYMAPELWTEGACSRASDVWAFGVMLHEMWAGARPFRGPGMVDLIADICGPQPAPAVDGPPELGALVARCLDKDPTERPSAEEVRDRLHALLHRAGPDVAVTDCPFRGLLPFTERDAAVFFGREAEVAAFVEQVRLQAVLPVIGASGAGKSSLVHAGVIARLREQQSWLVATVRPGARPLRTLAARLLQPVPPASQSGSGISVLSDSGLGPPRPSRPLTASAAAKRPARARGEPGDDDAIASTLLAAVPWSGTKAVTGEPPDRSATGPATVPVQSAVEALAADIRHVPARVGMALRNLALVHGQPVLLFVDQLEELFTLCDDAAERMAYLEAIGAAADDPQDPVRVVLAVRHDFIDRVAASPAMRIALGRAIVLQSPHAQALVETLVAPLRIAGYDFESPDMVAKMVAAVSGEPACLPLLQFTAQQLWERRDEARKLLLLSAYEAIGGVAGALARHADGVLARFGAAELAAARELLMRLVTPARTRRVLSRRQALDGLGREAEAVLGELTAARLVTVSRPASEGRSGGRDRGQAVLELAHESLVSTWTTLARWLDEGRDEIAFVQQAAQAAALWAERGRQPDELWQGAALERAASTLGRCSTVVPASVREFMAAALARGRRRRFRRRAAFGLVVLAAAVAFVLVTRAYRHEAVARAHEHEMQLAAQLSLAQAQAREAQRLALGKRFATARAYALSSLLHNPSHRGGKFYDAGFAARQPEGDRAALDARSVVYQAGARPGLALARILPGAVPFRVVGFSPSSLRLAAGSENGSVMLWEVETGRALWQRRVSPDRIMGLRFRADGAALAAVGAEGQILLLDPESGAERRRLPLPEGGIEVAWVGDRLAATTMAGKLVLFDSAASAPPMVISAHVGQAWGLDATRDGRTLVTAGWDGKGRIWSGTDGAARTAFEGSPEGFYRIAISPDERLVATAGYDRTVRLWELETGRNVAAFQDLTEPFYTVAWSPDGRTLAAGGAGGALFLWDVGTGALRQVIDGHRDVCQAVSWSPDGRRVATSSLDGTVRVWRVEPSGGARSLEHPGSVFGVAFAPDDDLVATASLDDRVRLWDRETGTLRRELGLGPGGVHHVVFAGSNVVAATWTGNVRIWDGSTGRIVADVAGPPGSSVTALDASASRIALSRAASQTVELLTADTGAAVGSLGASSRTVLSLALSPDGRGLFAAGTSATVDWLDLGAAGRARQLETGGDWVNGLALDRAGRTLATAERGGQVTLWDAASLAPLRRLEPQSRAANAVALSADGRWVAAGSDDRMVALWDGHTGRARLRLRLDGIAEDVALSPDGHWLAVASGRTATLYPLTLPGDDLDAERALAEALAHSGLVLEGPLVEPRSR